MKIIEIFRDKVFNYHLSRHQRKEAAFPHYDTIRSVMILYESDWMEKNPEVREIRDLLLTSDKDVVTWGYINKKEVGTAILPQSRIMGQTSTTLFGTLTEDTLTDLQKRHYDLLIDLTQHYCRPLHYAAMHVRADFKTGRHIVDGIHHFMLDAAEEATPKFLFEQIVFYLKNIKSNDKA